VIAGIAAPFIDPLLVNDGFWDSDSNSLAGATGLEPAASCVTGRRSNQLNYAPAISISYLTALSFLCPSIPETS
jgi:hypothetical protein